MTHVLWSPPQIYFLSVRSSMKALSTPLIGSFQFTTELTAQSNYRHRRFPAHYWGTLDFQTATPEGHLSSLTPTAEGCSLCWQAQLLRTCLTKRSARGAVFHTKQEHLKVICSQIFNVWEMVQRDEAPFKWQHFEIKRGIFGRTICDSKDGGGRNTCACWSSGNAHDFHTAAFAKHFIFLFFFNEAAEGWLLCSHWWGIVDAALRSACLFPLCLQGIGWSYKWKQLRSVRIPSPPPSCSL